MKLLVDVCLSPAWIVILTGAGWEAIHWSKVGSTTATDAEILEWAKAHEYVIFTHDLDFGTLLALQGAACPSVVQLRTQDVMPDSVGDITIAALRQFETELEAGALLTIDVVKSRVRLLPLRFIPQD